MEQVDLTLLLSFLGIVVPLLIPIIVGTWKIYNRINTLATQADAKKIHELINTDGFKQLLEFFHLSDPKDIVKELKNIGKLREYIEEQRKSADIISNIFKTTFVNEPIARIHAHIEANEKLSSRFNENKESKAFIKKHLTHLQTVQEVINNEESIFIESGSTLALTIFPLVSSIKDMRVDYKNRPIKICTNNIIIYIYLLFQDYIQPVLLPGKSTNSYGATFGDPLHADKCDIKAVEHFLLTNKVTTLFTTSSYLDVTYGPHVSSDANHDIKGVFNRYSSETGHKNIHVICAEKVNNDVEKNGQLDKNCQLIFEPRIETDGKKLYKIDELADAKARWLTFLRRPNNYFVIGGAGPNQTNAVVSLFLEVYPWMEVFKFPFEDGVIVTLSSKK